VGKALEKAVGEGNGVTSQGPPKAIEAVVALLIPPARREEVLGDLHERYHGAAAYLLDASRTVPHVVVNQVRRKAKPRLVISEAFALYLAFTIASPGSITSCLHKATAVPCAIVSLIALAVLALMDAYVQPGGRTEKRLGLQSLAAVAIACAAGAVIGVANPMVALPRRSLLVGGVIAALLVWRAAAGEGPIYRQKPDNRTIPSGAA
jgi:hypothetical protein